MKCYAVCCRSIRRSWARARTARLSPAKFAVALVMLLAVATPLHAQSGPYTVSAPANPKHDLVEQTVSVVRDYDLILTPDGASPLAPFNIGKPSITPSCVINAVTVQTCIVRDVDAYIKTLVPGRYTGVIRANGPGGSEVSSPSVPFVLDVSKPGPQGAPGISRSGTGS